MKIFITAITTQNDVFPNITSTTLPVDIDWYFDDGVNFGGGDGIAIPWDTTSTATSLNNEIKTAAINLIALQNGYQVDLNNDQIFLLCGFVGI